MKIRLFANPTVVRRPSPISVYLVFLETRIIDLQSVADNIGLALLILFCWCWAP